MLSIENNKINKKLIEKYTLYRNYVKSTLETVVAVMNRCNDSKNSLFLKQLWKFETLKKYITKYNKILFLSLNIINT